MLAGPKELPFRRGTSVKQMFLWEVPVHGNSSWLQYDWARKPAPGRRSWSNNNGLRTTATPAETLNRSYNSRLQCTHIGLFPRGACTIKCLRGCDKKARNSAVTRDTWRKRAEVPKIASGCPLFPCHLQAVGAYSGCHLIVTIATPIRPALVAGVAGRCSSSSDAQRQKVSLARRRSG